MACWWHKVAVAAVVAAVAHQARERLIRDRIPPHLLHHPARSVPGLLSEDDAASLRELAREMAHFPSNTQDVKFYKTMNEHIGEERPMTPEGGCDHRFLVPNVNRTACVLPGRIDIGRHYILTGGLHGHKETYDQLVARVLSFGRYIFAPDDYPVIKKLFGKPAFKAAAASVCPQDRQTLDPFQFNLIVQVPGQTVPLHIDAPYFWGASRFEFPQWLLAAMVFSNLFADRFINQVQVVAYFHQWEDAAARGGNFKYFADGSTAPRELLALPRAGSAIDGSKSVHAADVYMPEVRPPLLDLQGKSNALELADDAEGGWVLTSDNETVQRYADDELRWTVVYRARCFASEAERAQYHASTDQLSLDEILAVFGADLVRRGKVARGAVAEMARFDLALLLLDTYITYPYSEAVFPINYCALSKVWPKAHAALKYICH